MDFISLPEVIGTIVATFVSVVMYNQFKITKQLTQVVTKQEVKDMIEERVKHIDNEVSKTYNYIVRVDKKLDQIILELTKKPNERTDTSKIVTGTYAPEEH